MKKILPISILALALSFFISCKEGTSKTKEVPLGIQRRETQ